MPLAVAAGWGEAAKAIRSLVRALIHPFVVWTMLVLVTCALVMAFPNWIAAVTDQTSNPAIASVSHEMSQVYSAGADEELSCGLKDIILQRRTVVLILWVLLVNLVATFIWFYMHKSKNYEVTPRQTQGRSSRSKRKRKTSVFQQMITARDQRLDAIAGLLPVVPLGGHTCKIWQTVDESNGNGSIPHCRLTLDPEYSSHDALLKTGFITTWVQPPEYFPIEHHLYFEYVGYEPLLEEGMTIRIAIDNQVREFFADEYHCSPKDDGRGIVETLLVKVDQDLLFDLLNSTSFSFQIEDEVMVATPKLKAAINDFAVRFRKEIS